MSGNLELAHNRSFAITLSMLDYAIASLILLFLKVSGKDNVAVEVLKKLRQEDKEWFVHWYTLELSCCWMKSQWEQIKCYEEQNKVSQSRQ